MTVIAGIRTTGGCGQSALGRVLPRPRPHQPCSWQATGGARGSPASARRGDHRPYVPHSMAKLSSTGPMWPKFFSQHRQIMLLGEWIKSPSLAQDLVPEVGAEQQSQARLHPPSSSSGSGSSNRASTAIFPWSAPKHRRPRGLTGTRRTIGTLPRVITTSPPAKGSAIRCGRLFMASSTENWTDHSLARGRAKCGARALLRCDCSICASTWHSAPQIAGCPFVQGIPMASSGTGREAPGLDARLASRRKFQRRLMTISIRYRVR